jgi:acetylornithine deacetylase
MELLDETVAILDRLIAFPTVSSDSNLALIAYAADLLSRSGARISLTEDATGQKANLFATLGPEGDGGIVLSGHSDVVPVEGQDWSSDPFRLIETDGLLYGRGACDMKGFIAAVLANVPRFAALDLARPLHIALTYDEETGCLGAQTLIEDLRRRDLRPALAIIGEPTSMRLIEGHKGCFEYTTEFSGLEGHGSEPDRGVNAVEYAVRYSARLMELAEDLKGRVPKTSRFDPPWTTLQIGRLDGGIARNVIPGACFIEWEMRPVQGNDGTFVKESIDRYAETVLKPAMRTVAPQADIVRHTIAEVAGFEPADDNEALRIVQALTGANTADLVSFGTEAGLYQDYGLACVICGPGSIEQAHKPDEYVSREQLAACLAMLAGLDGKLRVPA